MDVAWVGIECVKARGDILKMTSVILSFGGVFCCFLADDFVLSVEEVVLELSVPWCLSFS